MKKMSWMVWTGCLVLSAWLATGCDPTSQGSDAIGLTPPSASIDVEGTQVFTATAGSSTNVEDDLVLPLVWSLEDRSLGRIQASGGTTAIYEAFGSPGNNAVIVRDQLGREAVASITQSIPTTNDTAAAEAPVVP